MQPPDAVETLALVKRFGPIVALDGIDLRVPAGRFFGLLGPNGAGKTTAVSILCTLLRPDSGEAKVLGDDAVTRRAAVRRHIGIVFQEPSLDTELSGRENLEIHARLYHLSDRASRIEAMLDLMGVREHADRRVAVLSGGLRRRLEIARGLLHQPRVLFLDEPSLGLDVPARRAIWEHLERLRERRELTLILTSHAMDEVERLCDEVAILDGGRVAASGTPRELCRRVGGDRVEFELDDARAAAAALEALPRIEGVHATNGAVAVTVEDAPAQLVTLVEAVRPHGIHAVRMREANLEDAFLALTGHGIGPDGEPM
jgi:ABC-2 type transport system ATP-binding protein